MDGRQTNGWTVKWWEGDERRKWKRSDWLCLNCWVTCAPGILQFKVVMLWSQRISTQMRKKVDEMKGKSNQSWTQRRNEEWRSHLRVCICFSSPSNSSKVRYRACTTFLKKQNKRTELCFPHINKRKHVVAARSHRLTVKKAGKAVWFSPVQGLGALMCRLQSCNSANKSAIYSVFTPQI